MQNSKGILGSKLVDLPGLYEGGVGGVRKSWGYTAKVGAGKVERKVCISLKVAVGGGHRVVWNVLSQFCILELGRIWVSQFVIFGFS